jgi:diacylglycerol kinase family enzyme
VTAHTCVIYNPAADGGRSGWAVRRLRRRFPAAVFRPTAGPGHAVELAKQAADEFARVAAAGGDGTAHEVANGLLLADRPAVFAAWPAGSMNDYAHACGLDRGPLAGPLRVVAADVLRVTTGGRSWFAINGVGVGFNGMVTVESWHLRRLNGHALYAAAFLLAGLRRFATPPVTVTFDGADRPTEPLLAATVNVGSREGGFPLFPHARLDDGVAETLLIGAVRRLELPRHLPGLLAGRLPDGHPHVHRGTCRSARFRSEAGLCVHADGEVIRRPGGGPTDIAVELLPGRLPVEVRAG